MTTYVTEVWKLKSTITCRGFQNLPFQEHGGQSSLSIFFTYINFMFFSEVLFTEESMTSLQNGSLLSYHNVIFYTLHTTYLFVVFITDRFHAPVTSSATTMFLNNVPVDHLGILLNADSDSVCLGQCLRVCISSQLPSDAYAMVHAHTLGGKDLLFTQLMSLDDRSLICALFTFYCHVCVRVCVIHGGINYLRRNTRYSKLSPQ